MGVRRRRSMPAYFVDFDKFESDGIKAILGKKFSRSYRFRGENTTSLKS